MTVNEERDIILNGLYLHFGGHKISYSRVIDYCISQGMERKNIDDILFDLEKDDYIKHDNPTQLIDDYSISPKGKTLLQEYKGFVGKAESHLRDLNSNSFKIITINIPTIKENSSPPTVILKGRFRNSLTWI